MSEGSNTWKYVGIGCGILALLGVCSVGGCLVFCGGTMGAVFAATEAPVEETRTYFGNIRSGRTDAAYAQMSSAYQAANSLEGFQAAIASMPELTSSTDQTILQRNVQAGSGADIGGNLHLPDGDRTFEVHLIEEGGGWRVAALMMAGRPL